MSYAKIARDYISEVEIVKDGAVVAQKNIEVNHPLHYGGYYLYQPSWGEDHGSVYTVLTVASDSGLKAVYAGYAMLMIGLCWRFWARRKNSVATPLSGVCRRKTNAMAVKYTLQGLLIYATIALYVLALIATAANRRKAGRALFLIGFLTAAAAVAYRWVHVAHVPMQNLFEVFLVLGALCYPISWFSRRVLHIGGQWADMLLGIIVLFPAGFVFSAEPMQLPPALQSWLFGPHVAVYMLSYVFMAKAAFQAGEAIRQHIRLRPAAA